MNLKKRCILLFFAIPIILLLTSSAHINNIFKNNPVFMPSDFSLKDSGDITPPKFVYLTFDDGPSSNTLEILKILKQYDIKATFFVNGHPKFKALNPVE